MATLLQHSSHILLLLKNDRQRGAMLHIGPILAPKRTLAALSTE